MFTRRHVVISSPSTRKSQAAQAKDISPSEYRVLVINGSSEMAKEISLQLTLTIPGCSIMYAPSLELARLILARREVDLVVSSTTLPDGSLLRLKSLLTRLSERPGRRAPNVVLVGDASEEALSYFAEGDYDVSHMRRVGNPKSLPPNTFHSLRGRVLRKASAHTIAIGPQRIRSLGADLRNDLNNPLQEIVAMVFVAKSASGNSTESTSRALDAIDKAAKNMASVVRGLEDKIRDAVTESSLPFK